MKQITVTDSNSWEREKFSFIFNNPSREFVEFVTESATYDSHMSVRESEYTKEDVKSHNFNSRNSYMNRYGFYEEPDVSNSKPEEGYNDFFYKGVGVVEIKDRIIKEPTNDNN